MNKEIKKRWVKALESGDYKQGKSALVSNGKFCCLGVLCTLYLEDHKDQNWKTLTPMGLDDDQDLPNCVREWAELDRDPLLGTKGAEVIVPDSSKPFLRTCSVVNDYLGYDFNQIAKEIKKWL
jgi:hypothetical protein